LHLPSSVRWTTKHTSGPIMSRLADQRTKSTTMSLSILSGQSFVYRVRNLLSLCIYTTFQKSKPLDVDVGKCGPIFKILSPRDS